MNTEKLSQLESAFTAKVGANPVLSALMAFGFLAVVKKKVLCKWFPNETVETVNAATMALNELGQSPLSQGKMLSARAWSKGDKLLAITEGTPLARIMGEAFNRTVDLTVKEIAAGKGYKRIVRPRMESGEAVDAPDYRLAVSVLRKAGFSLKGSELGREAVIGRLEKYAIDSAAGKTKKKATKETQAKVGPIRKRKQADPDGTTARKGDKVIEAARNEEWNKDMVERENSVAEWDKKAAKRASVAA